MNVTNKIFKCISDASIEYTVFAKKVGVIAREAQKHIDWDDDVSCDYMPGDGVCIEINAHVCPATRFFVLVEESEKGFIDKETYLANCI